MTESAVTTASVSETGGPPKLNSRFAPARMQRDFVRRADD
jgi:hypothetical protein